MEQKPTISQFSAIFPLLSQFQTRQIWIDYDKEADVLYVSFRRPQNADDSELTEDGVIYRYSKEQLVGITILNARKYL